jgi:phage baseplate assembly protein W
MATIKTPFVISESGRVARVLDQNTIARQQITDVLVTGKRERTARPGYGAGALELLFEPIDDLVYSEFKMDAMMEVNKQVSSAAVMNMTIAPASIPYFSDDTASTIEITAQYRTSTNDIQSFSFQIANPDLMTEETLL